MNRFYKKQLKSKYRSEEAWKKRFKYEYENMLRLVKSPYVLKVFNYDESNDSYLMENVIAMFMIICRIIHSKMIN